MDGMWISLAAVRRYFLKPRMPEAVERLSRLAQRPVSTRM
jgi:hypothetical protein